MTQAAKRIGIGSVPTRTALQQAFARLLEGFQALHQKGDPVTIHNAFTSLVVLVLLLFTGHRPGRDPFCWREQIDEQWGVCLINDKDLSSAHTWRLVGFPRVAATWLAAYFNHLDALVRILIDHGQRPLAQQVQALIRFDPDRGVQRLPLFFYLDTLAPPTRSVTPQRLKDTLGKPWPFELNAGRKFLASYLRETGIAAEYVYLQLGHLDSFHHPFGINGLRAPAEVLPIVSAAIDRLADQLNLAVPQGLTVAKPAPALPPPTGKSLHEALRFGDQHRTAQRERHDAAIRQTIRQYLGPNPIETLRKDTDLARQIQKTILKDTNIPESCLDRVLTLYHRYLRYLHRREGGFTLPPPCKRPLPEATPFSKTDLMRYRNSIDLRTRLVDHLRACGKRTTPNTPAHQVAIILLVAALSEGLCTSDSLQRLIDALHRGIHQYGPLTWLDLIHPLDPLEGVRDRWWVDEVGFGALVGLDVLLKQGQGLPSEQVVARELVTLLSSVNVTVTDNQVFNTVARLARGFWKMHFPGFVREIAFGRTAHTPLQPPALMRLLTGKPVRLHEPPPDASEIVQLTQPVQLTLTTPTTPAWVKGYKSRMRKALKAVRNAEVVATNQRPLGQKKRLVQQLKRRFGGQSLPSLGFAFVQWLTHLAKHGTPATPKIKYSSIEDYYYAIADPLLQVAWDMDLRTMDQGDFESLYETVLAYSRRNKKATEATREYRAICMGHFHRFLEDHFNAVAVDPSVFSCRATKMPTPIHANALGEAEYQQVLIEIRDTTPDAFLALRYQCLLIFEFRFGCRINEARRLQPRHLQRDHRDQNQILDIAPTVQGDTKRPASTRTTPAGRELRTWENDLVNTLWRYASDRLPLDAQAGLFAKAGHTRELIDEQAARIAIQAAMHRVTGDAAMVNHHVRHGAAQVLLTTALPGQFADGPLRMCFPETTDATDRLRALLTGQTTLNSALLVALRVAMGHAHIRTLFDSYIHIGDLYVVEYVRAAPTLELDDQALAGLLNRTSASVCSKRFNHNIPKAQARDVIRTYKLKHLQLASTHFDVISKIPDVAPPAAPCKDRHALTLAELDRLLGKVATTSRHAQLAQEFSLTLEEIDQLLARAIDLETRTGFTGYQLHPISTPAAPDRGWAREATPMQSLLQDWQQRLDKLDDAARREAAQVTLAWAHANRANYPGLVFTDAQRLQQFIQGGRRYGWTSRHLHGYRPDVTSDRIDRLVDVFAHHRIDCIGPATLPKAIANIPAQREERVALKFRSNCGLPYPRRLYRGLFIAHLWFQWHDDYPVD